MLSGSCWKRGIEFINIRLSLRGLSNFLRGIGVLR
ncbi:hypothetical protein LINPERPRIM_LOCUS32809 [Linum perenne]